MTIILFTLIDLEFNQRINPYDQAGAIHNSGLDFIGLNVNLEPAIPQLATTYMTTNYSSYPAEMYSILATLGYNSSIDPVANLSGIDLNGGCNSLVQKVFKCFLTLLCILCSHFTPYFYFSYIHSRNRRRKVMGN